MSMKQNIDPVHEFDERGQSKLTVAHLHLRIKELEAKNEQLNGIIKTMARQAEMVREAVASSNPTHH